MFTKETKKFIEEINSNVTIYRHDKTKARLCTIENDDPNKVFSIAFRTPPINDTGLTHILEHSVLCGSKKYPVKDPFVELLKGSLNTFLNAFTFPDKTMYPVASMNDKDFNNLMSVYLDAVFYPNIYKYEEIFKQEGWHYHLESKDDPITLNGVVYNEMKGAFSDPEQVLGRCIMHSLYPHTAYGFESGGDPKYIPNLSYEEFKKFHSEYYHPSNSYIFIYGDCDMEERMKFIEDNYLNNYDYNSFDTKIALEPPFKEATYEEHFYPIGEDESLDNKYYLSYNVSISNTLDIKKCIALEVLSEVLFSAEGAPIKEAILDLNICEDIDVTYESGIYQPFLSISLMKSDIKYLDKFKEVLENSLKNVKLDKERILASLNYREFKVREAKFDGPKGLLYQMNMLDGWLYDDNMPYHKLCVLDYFKELRSELDTNYFYDLINECIINNTHKSIVVLSPSKTYKSEEDEKLRLKLKEYKDNLSEEEILKLVESTKNLEIYQETPSSREDIAKLPKLSIEDLNPNPMKYKCDVVNNGYNIYYSQYFTNNIGYLDLVFDISEFSDNDLKYAKLLSTLLIKLSTKNRGYIDIDKDIKLNTGGVMSFVRVFKDIDGNNKVLFEIKASMLDDKIDNAMNLVSDVLFNTLFSDKKKLQELLLQRKSIIENSIAGIGHQISLQRAKSYINEVDYIRDITGGIGFVDFIRDVVNNFDASYKKIIDNLENTYNKIKNKNRFMVSLTSDKKLYDKIISNVNNIYNKLGLEEINKPLNRKLEVLNEGFKTQFNVNYVAKATRFTKEYSGVLLVLKNALSLDYLWTNIRVKGGAYGAMISVTADGILCLTSYRDPNIKRTYDIYNNLGNYINDMNITDEDLLKFKIGAIGALDDSMHVSTMGDNAFLEKITGFDYEFRSKIRKEIIEASIEELKSYGDDFNNSLKTNNICVIGSANLIDENKDLFNNIRKLIK
ncbi:MAG: insulinase family protein [Anaeroplasmataceae bacterium]